MRLENFAKFIKYYGKGRKFQFFGFLILALISGVFELLGILLVYPFMMLLLKPQLVIETKQYMELVKLSHVHNVLINTFIIGGLILGLFLLANLSVIFILFLQNKFVNNWKIAIGKRFLQYYLFSPYRSSLKSKPSEKIYNLNYLINQCMEGFILKILNCITSFTVVAAILGLLFYKFAFAAVVASVFVLFSLFIQHKIFRSKISVSAHKLLKVSSSYNEKILENVNNVRTIKALACENYFYDEFSQVQKDYYKTLCANNFYTSISQSVIEIFVVIGLFILAGIILIQNISDKSWMVVSYAVLAVAMFRIIPFLGKIKNSLENISSARNFVKTMIAEYESLDFHLNEEIPDIDVEFRKSLILKNVSFSYKKTPAIKDLSLEIKRGDFCSIVGPVGAGKSTLINILMGLLPVDSGEVYLDDIKIDEKYLSLLRKLVSYVPKQIVISDDTYKKNIAFGVREDQINENKIKEVLQRVKMYDYVMGLENGLGSRVSLGLNGISEGFKYKLGIARALYRDTEILVVEEPSTLMDLELEQELIELLISLKGEKTILVSASKKQTLVISDKVLYLKNGQSVGLGSYNELLQLYPDLEQQIRLSK